MKVFLGGTLPVGNGEMSCSHYLNATIIIQL